MTKVMCGRLDCEFLGEGYICQKKEIQLGSNYSSTSDEYISCTEYKKDKRWDNFVKALQMQVDKGEVVI